MKLDRPGAAADNGRRTLAEELRLQLADEIVRGDLAPGAALDETELARRFQVSRTPVREAIRQLAASGLVEARAASRRDGGAPGRGAARRHVRGDGRARGAVRGACGRAHDRRRAALARGHARGAARADPERRPAALSTRSTRRSTARIYAGAHNAYLAELTLATRARVQPFRRAQFRNLGRLAKSHGEHERRGGRDPARRPRRRGERHARPHQRGCARNTRPMRSICERLMPARSACGHDMRASRRTRRCRARRRPPRPRPGSPSRARPSASTQRADRQRRRHRRDEAAEALGRAAPRSRPRSRHRCRPPTRSRPGFGGRDDREREQPVVGRASRSSPGSARRAPSARR